MITANNVTYRYVKKIRPLPFGLDKGKAVGAGVYKMWHGYRIKNSVRNIFGVPTHTAYTEQGEKAHLNDETIQRVREVVA